MKKVTLPLLILSLLAVSCMSSSSYFGKTEPPYEQVFRYWNAAEPRSFDPHKTAGVPEFNIITSYLEPLTTYDPKTLDPRPGVAERWEALDQAKRWIFYLRKNSKWTDGKVVTAHDFVWAWQRGVKPETAAPYVSLLYHIKNAESISKGEKDASELGVRALDDFTLEVEMERPTAFFDKMTSHYIFAPLPKWIIEKYGDKWTRPENIIGNGAFKVVEHTPYSQVVAVKSSTYWDAASVKLDKVIFIHLENNSTGLNLYKAGDVYTMQTGSIPLPFLKVLKQKKDYRKGSVFTTYFYTINVTKEPFKDLRVRRALNLAIDKAAITDKLIGKGDVPATSVVPSGVPGYESAKGGTYDPEKAKQLLAEAGFAEGKGFPKITIYFNTSDAHRQIAEAVQRMWKETLKINVELQNEEWQTFQARWENREFDICRDAWQGDYLDPNAFLELFATKSPNNHCGWVDEKYKSLLDAANSEPDREKRMRMLRDVEQMLVDEVPIIPLYHYGMSYLQKPFVEGWYENLFDIHPMKYVSIDTNWKPELNTVSTERRRQ